MHTCPHRGAVVHAFRQEITTRLDATLSPVSTLLAEHKQRLPASIRLYYAPCGDDCVNTTDVLSLDAPPRQPSASPASRVRLIFVVRRSRGDNESAITACRRCLWNIDHLARSLALAHPGALTVLANPSDLSFDAQYLFRASDLLLGVHGAALAWGVFLTPTQAGVEAAEHRANHRACRNTRNTQLSL
jgi:hypothetical protein